MGVRTYVRARPVRLSVANYRQAAAYDGPQYKVEGGKVYETDAYGRVQQQKFIIKDEQRRSK
jgi:hypothetical protein